MRGLLTRCPVRLLAILLAMLALADRAHAVEPDEILSDPRLEARARAISLELRCLVCQNQSIDDSNAPLARDLRILVRERLKAGDSDEAVIGYIVDRYGEFVLLRPAFGLHTLLLWLAPLAILLAAGGAIAWRLRRAAASPPPAALSAEEQARLKALLDDQRQ
ncbi:MAG TPA: cytochrome c-type biogenesis protein [Hyphomicrobiaceae bacterium]|nr:cytochrome c-type biogenesis protein [Hyphomicrobiaceae bacterium]